MGLLCVASPKGGTGVSMVSANLANLICLAGHRVTLIDLSRADLLKLNLGVQAEASAEASNDETLPGRVPLVSTEGVNILNLSALVNDPRRLTERLLACLDENRVVVVDLPAEAAAVQDSLLGLATLALWVVTPEAAAMACLPHMLEGFGKAASDQIVVNRFDPRKAFHNDATLFLFETFGREKIASVRADEAVNEAFAALEPLTAFSGTSAALSDLDQLAYKVLQTMTIETAALAGGRR